MNSERSRLIDILAFKKIPFLPSDRVIFSYHEMCVLNHSMVLLHRFGLYKIGKTHLAVFNAFLGTAPNRAEYPPLFVVAKNSLVLHRFICIYE